MGVLDLYKVLDDASKDEYLVEYHYSELTGMRIAVDISIFLYKNIRTCGKPNWIKPFILFLCGFKKHGIKMVCIFDGPNPPPEKKEEQERRRADNQRQKERLKRCIEVRNKLQDEYLPLDITPEPDLIKECKTLLQPKKGSVDVTNYYEIDDIVDSLNSRIEILEKQTLPITEEDRNTAFKIVQSLGLAALKADGEAETLCAYLAVNDYVNAVLTEDTDVLAYGTPFMLTYKKDKKVGGESLYGIHLPSLLKDMKMDVEEFRDLCILLSCDYNKRVKGFPPDGKKRKKSVGIGAKGALCMIQEYRRLEEVCKYVEDPTPLRYRRCRELFTPPKSTPLFEKNSEEDTNTVVPLNKPLNLVELRKYLPGRKGSSEVENMIGFIEKHYKPPKLMVRDDDSDDSDEDFSSQKDDFLENLEESSSSDEDFELPIEKEEVFHDLTKVVCVILTTDCQNVNSGEHEIMEAHFKFMTQDLLDRHEDTGFDDLIEPFNDWLEANNHKGWIVDDVIEIVKFIPQEDAILPYVVTK